MTEKPTVRPTTHGDSGLVHFPGHAATERDQLGIEQVREAAERIRPYIRHTPVMQARLPSFISGERIPVRLKLENLQVAGEAHVRGVLNYALSVTPELREKGIVTASWGTFDSALAYVGEQLNFPTTIYLSGPGASREKVSLLEHMGARVAVKGSNWAATDRLARRYAESAGMTYLHPFSEPKLIIGHATVGLEILEDIPDLTVLVVPGGGGGGSIMSGTALAVKHSRPGVRVVGVEVDRVARLHHALKEGQHDFLGERGYFGPLRLPQIIFDLVSDYVDDLIVVTDDERHDTLCVLYNELEIAAGAFGATALTAVLWERLGATDQGSVCAIVGASGEAGLF